MSKEETTISLNVYNDDDEVVKTVKASNVKIRFGTIRIIMKLVNMEEINDNVALMKTIYGAWEELTRILTKCFPDMEDDDWNGVNLEDLVPVIVWILKDTVKRISTIPQNQKNGGRE